MMAVNKDRYYLVQQDTKQLSKPQVIKQRHDADSAIILFICASITLCLIPFCVIRILQADWPVASLNIIITAISFAVFCHVYFTHKTQMARWGLSLLSAFAMLMTIYLKGPEQIYWLFPTLTTVFYMLSAHFAAIMGVFFLIAAFSIVYPNIDAVHLLTIGSTAAITYVFSYAFSVKMHRQAFELQNEAETDPLTLLGNRRALDIQIDKTMAKSVNNRNGKSSLLVIDIDHFKQVNDSHGHECGDKVLQGFAKVIRNGIRGKDSAFRFGGEEFVVILENTALSGAQTLANNLLKDIESREWGLPENQVITASVGVAEFTRGESSSDWISRADVALYEAKNRGRNQAVVAE